MVKDLIGTWLIPQGFLNLRRNYLRAKRAHSILFKENKSLYQKEVNTKRCFILATGPSINLNDLTPLDNELCISVSNFFVHEEYTKIKPKYHVLAPSHLPITKEHYATFLNDLIDHTNFETTLLLSASDRQIIESLKVPDNLTCHFYKIGGDHPINFEKPIPDCRTVIHQAIYLSIYLGIKKIYLLGVDHSWANHYGVSKHFYEEAKNKLVENNYNEWRHPDIGKLFEGYGKTWDLYRNIRDYYTASGVEIINLNPDSVLDIFPKMKLNEIIG